MNVKLNEFQTSRLESITHMRVIDDDSFARSLSRLFEMYNNQGINIKYLQDECTKNGIKTLIN